MRDVPIIEAKRYLIKNGRLEKRTAVGEANEAIYLVVYGSSAFS
jgi:hypothetical protein